MVRSEGEHRRIQGTVEGSSLTIIQFGFFSNGRGPRSSLEHVSASAFAAAAMSCGRVWALTGALVVGYLAIYKYFSAHGLDLFYVHDLLPDRE